MKLTYYGHSCFSVESKGKKLLFDPFITYNDLANSKIDVDAVEADYILVSHGHQDHTADLVRIASRTGARVICAWEIHTWLEKQQITNVHPMNTGGKWDFGDFAVKCVVAQHSSSLPDGSYGGNPLGFIIYGDSRNFYYSGDTALTLDMQLIPRWARPDLAVLCIGDNFTMGYEDAIEAARMVQCNTVVGVHYDTFPYIKIDHKKVKQAFTDAGITLHLPGIGESMAF